MRLVVALGFACALLFGGCAQQGDPSLSVTGLDDLRDCEVSAGSDGIAQNTWDLNAGRGYLAGPQLASQLRQNATDIGADKAILRVEGVEVELFEADATTPLGVPVNPYTSRGSTTIESASGGGDISTGAIAVTLIPSIYIPDLEALLPPAPTAFDSVTIVAEIIPFGRTLGNVNVTGKNYVFPITICSGCLQNCSPDFEEAECLGGQDGVQYCLAPP